MPKRRIGRPLIGGQIDVRIGEDRKATVDTYAAEHGISEAEAVRRLLDAGIRATTRRTTPS